MRLEPVTLVGGQVIAAHSKASCKGGVCSIHNPSNHHMKDWPQNWRDTLVMERICPHGVGHPDPDHLSFISEHYPRLLKSESVHGCDGCCRRQS